MSALNYFFIDGSALNAQIRNLRRANEAFKGKRLCPKLFVGHFMDRLFELHGGAYKRAIFYFPKGDENDLANYIDVPDRKQPGNFVDIHFKFCGHKLKRSAEFSNFVEEKVPPHFRDRFSKSEKGIDIEICCDALRLASSNKIDRLFILTNDSDFVPLFKTIKEFGSNISLILLSSGVNVNADLLNEVDSYDVVLDEALPGLFGITNLSTSDLFSATSDKPIEVEQEDSIEENNLDQVLEPPLLKNVGDDS